MMPQLDTPVAILIFNRPETTRRVFEEIRHVRPRQLLVVADGPRVNRPGEAEACAAARAIVAEVDWPCEVLTNYADANLGCKRRVSSGLDWVFSTVEEAIILEDDCVPHPSFFPYCAELLERYRDDERVMHISGSNFLFGQRQGEASYYFSRYAHVWGWASWRRAWRYYDVGIARWPSIKASLLGQFEHPQERRFWAAALDKVYHGQIDTWDYQWSMACMERGGLAVQPNVNLVTNIGFGEDATHTTGVSHLADMPANMIELPLVHPPHIVRATQADDQVRRLFFMAGSPLQNLVKRVVDRLTKAAPKLEGRRLEL